MRIRRLIVEKLLNSFDYTISFNLKPHMTIIYGLNGTGKTKILNMVHDVFNNKLDKILALPFDIITIEFDNDYILRIKRTHSRLIIESNRKGNNRFLYEREQKLQDDFDFGSKLNESIQYLRKRYEIFYEGNNRWMDRKNRMNISTQKLKEHIDSFYKPTTNFRIHLRRILEVLDRKNHSSSKKSFIPEWFLELIKKIDCRFITTTRLFKSESRREQEQFTHKEYFSLGGTNSSANTRLTDKPEVIENYSNDIKHLISKKLAELGELSQEHDRSFISRVIKFKSDKEIKFSLTKKLEDINRKRKQLIEIGLLDPETDSEIVSSFDKEKIEPGKVDMLAVYVEDALEKLGLFDDLYQKLDVLKDMVNSLFQFKRFNISKREGFEIKTDKGKNLRLSDLSSGEKHLFVLLNELLFKARPNSLILIDEPEISLHVAWQELFLANLEKIIEVNPIDVLMATHSSEIIYNRWDLTVLLGEKDEQ